MSSTSSSSATVRRVLTITRSKISKFVDGRTQGYRVRFDVTDAVDMVTEIFVYQRRPGTLPDSPVRDEFSNVASPADLEEYPVDAPVSTSPFFRLRYADLIFRSLALLEQSSSDLLSDIAQLVETLDQFDVLTERLVTITGKGWSST